MIKILLILAAAFIELIWALSFAAFMTCGHYIIGIVVAMFGLTVLLVAGGWE